MNYFPPLQRVQILSSITSSVKELVMHAQDTWKCMFAICAQVFYVSRWEGNSHYLHIFVFIMDYYFSIIILNYLIFFTCICDNFYFKFTQNILRVLFNCKTYYVIMYYHNLFYKLYIVKKKKLFLNEE